MSGNNHQISFERDSGEWNSAGKKAKDHKMAFGKGSGAHTVVFHVGTPTGRYQFSEEDPIWVKEDDGECPDAACSYPDIEVKSCKSTQLIIENKNDTKARLRYQLNVYDTEKSEWCPIDPIMDNGGHG